MKKIQAELNKISKLLKAESYSSSIFYEELKNLSAGLSEGTKYLDKIIKSFDGIDLDEKIVKAHQKTIKGVLKKMMSNSWFGIKVS